MVHEKFLSKMNRNIKIMPSYIALTWDVIFVWTISTLFFTTQKGLSYSQVIALDSILMLFGCIMCVPINKLFNRMSTINATRLATFGYGAYLILCIVGNSYPVFIVAQFFLSFAYCVNSVRINTLTVDSLKIANRKRRASL